MEFEFGIKKFELELGFGCEFAINSLSLLQSLKYAMSMEFPEKHDLNSFWHQRISFHVTHFLIACRDVIKVSDIQSNFGNPKH